jgi:hypothetical protein
VGAGNSQTILVFSTGNNPAVNNMPPSYIGQRTLTTTQFDAQWVLPVAGSIDNLTVKSDVTPGSSGVGYTITVIKNASTSTTLTCNITTTTTCSLTGAVAFVAGDQLSIKIVELGSGAPFDTKVQASVTFTK